MTATGQAELASSAAKLDPYVSAGDAGLVLNAPENVLAEVPEAHLVELRAALAKKNTADQQEAATGEERGAADAAGFTYIVGMVNTCKHENGWTYIYLIGAPPFTAGTVVCNPFG